MSPYQVEAFCGSPFQPKSLAQAGICKYRSQMTSQGEIKINGKEKRIYPRVQIRESSDLCLDGRNRDSSKNLTILL